MANPSVWQHISRRPVETYNKIWLGAIALAVIGSLVGAMLLVKAIGVGYSHYTAEFLQAASLQPGANVSYAGVPVGNVTSVELAGDRIEVGMRVRDDITLRKDAKASIKITTILGNQYVELRNGGDGKLTNHRIDLAHTDVPYDLQATLQDATSTFEQVDADKIAESTAILGKQLEGLPAVLPQAMENIQTLSSVISHRRDQIGTLLASTEMVTGTLYRQQGDIGKLIMQGRDLLGEFVSRRASFHSMMQALAELVNVLSKIVVKDRPAVDALIADVRTFSKLIGGHDDLFRSLLQVTAVAARNVTNFTGYGNALELNAPSGLAIDSWVCAISGRAKQFNMIEYFKDCQ
ncbi:Putative Mce family protein [Mycobacteroides abscessus]|uniref:MlaD family protein n=1 Tax=Mycobacteroides abscessus TaxID=36809 RepID=UPI0005E2BED9|nr:MlaD family protein [Mycobacteroides abscessus]CPT98257.1 Putative Mce family protein [Mycobacteroides abscessus]CPX14587.1 Putative Mce family protein [Mycobacteroides abscessus]CPZ99560.1 Putative Mce family protein [Mycobacteroides abscessus]